MISTRTSVSKNPNLLPHKSQLLRPLTGATVMLLGLTFSGIAQTATANPAISMKEISFAGTGCSSANTAASISPDGQALTVFFNEFSVASDGSQKRLTTQRRYCDLNIKLEAPQGWSYAIMGVDYRGYAALNARSTVGLTTSVKTDTRGWKSLKTSYFRGPLADEYLENKNMSVDTSSWSPCLARKRYLKLRTVVDLWSAARNADLFTIDSIDGELSQKFNIQWRQCTVAQTDAEEFASRLYADTIGNTEDTGGLQQEWASLYLKNKSRYLTSMRAVYSKESRLSFTRMAYQKLLGRDPSSQELDRTAAYHSFDAIHLHLLSSVEYYNRSGANFEGFLTALYRDVYGNEVALDLNGWNSLRYNTRYDIARRLVWSEAGRLVAIRRGLVDLLKRPGATLDDARPFLRATGKRPTQEMIDVTLMSTDEYIKP